MMTVEDAARIAMGLPEVTEGLRYGNRTWIVNKKGFTWERPFSKADIKRFGDRPPPAGPILAISVADLSEKEAVLATNPEVFFTIEHFSGYPAILAQLDKVTKRTLTDAIVDGWLAAAPPALATSYLAGTQRQGSAFRNPGAWRPRRPAPRSEDLR